MKNSEEIKNNDIIAFGMTRQVVFDALNDIKKECASNEQDSTSCSEYAQHMKKGREMLKKQAGYYPFLPNLGGFYNHRFIQKEKVIKSK